MTTQQRSTTVAPGGSAAVLADLAHAQQRIAQLTEALDTRGVIGRAQGIIMERYEVDEGQALEVLKRVSSQSDIPLRDIAAHLVETRRLPK
ncbi:ANTAR domain-containing protein [Nocardioides sp. MAH-18]|uniref:ANTAR domain-containing protein n=1 Tax=Nocardioides agri TaxID=2682843 RepID=A0A6L6XWL8_9ACTN|nr:MULTISPECIES: ANTAR domain-containing protein [unclassified Nocardioides]MBA2956274.1 ANTAR domain-containing protein [Nocardioides sp. CGMCC 1.13656]MVQ51117.1 ANTAR domain-containing protein [Nocardioides sp. MAH-18]